METQTELHPMFEHFRTGVYKELDKLKNRLSGTQKQCIEAVSFDGGSPSNNLYGQIFKHAGNSASCRFQSKGFSTLSNDLSDADAFTRGNSFTALEKVLFAEPLLIHEVEGYVCLGETDTPKLNKYIEKLTAEIITLKTTKVLDEVITEKVEEIKAEVKPKKEAKPKATPVKKVAEVKAK